MKLWCGVLVAALLLNNVAGMAWRVCDDNGDAHFVPDKVLLSPDPPTIGDSVAFSISGTAGTTVTSGELDIIVSIGGAEIYEEAKDLCDRTKCPITPGPLQILYKQDLPPIAPPGDYSVKVVARDGDGQELMCIVVDFSLVLPGAKYFRKTKDFLGGRKGAPAFATL